MSMLPRMRMTSFIAGFPDDTMKVYSYVQLLEHGEMPLPTFENVVEMLETNNPEARRIMVHHHEPGQWWYLWTQLMKLQQEIVRQATDDDMKFELHVIDRRPKRGKKVPVSGR